MAENESGLFRPLSQMSFVVTTDSEDAGTAAFSEVTGIEGSVDVIEFRQGNAGSMNHVKLPGLVKHGNVTLKFGYTESNAFKTWVMNCVNEQRSAIERVNLTIELIDTVNEDVGSGDLMESDGSGAKAWVLTNAWAAKYTGADLNAGTSGVAIESVEIAYEKLTIPNG